MSHRRARIRAAIADALNATPALSGRVVTTRTRRTAPDELPVAIVYALREDSQRSTLQGQLDRIAIATIELRVRDGEGLDDAIDELCVAVEKAMDADPRFGGLAFSSSLHSTRIGLDTSEGETTQAVCTLEYRVDYRTARGAPDA